MQRDCRQGRPQLAGRYPPETMYVTLATKSNAERCLDQGLASQTLGSGRAGFRYRADTKSQETTPQYITRKPQSLRRYELSRSTYRCQNDPAEQRSLRYGQHS